MMHEEFIKLTGIEVSHRYYTERIEPEYTEADTDKETFCAQWVKAHKSDICKALASDIDGLIRDAALTDALRTKSDEKRRLKVEAEARANELEHRNRVLTKANQSLREEIASFRKEIEELEKEGCDFKAVEREIIELKEAHEKALTAKDMEITKLKAMLFDQMYKTA